MKDIEVFLKNKIDKKSDKISDNVVVKDTKISQKMKKTTTTTTKKQKKKLSECRKKDKMRKNDIL